ncbi:hypothetical protein EV714DRAFT_278078 [Schizophyllum commune]
MKLRQGKTIPSGWDGPTIDTDLDIDELIREHGSEEYDGSDDEGDYDLSDEEDNEGDSLSSYAHPLPRSSITSPSPPPATASSPPLAATTPFPSAAPATKSREKRKSHEKRRRKRAHMQLTKKPWELSVRPSARRKYVDFARPIKTNLQPASLRITRTGYTAMRDEKADKTRKRTYRLSDMVGPSSTYNFKLYEWDGVTTVPILDKKRRVIAVLAGTPDQKDWPKQHVSLADAIEAARPHLKFAAIQTKHRRGAFPAVAVGHSYGGGQTRPMSVSQEPSNVPILHALLTHIAFIRLAGFATGIIANWAPLLFAYYAKYCELLSNRLPDISFNFPTTVWAAVTINFGPRTISLRHRDYANLAWGWCPITALGRFDPDAGGHLILWDLRLVIRFPPGSTIAIPSGLLTHSNTAIGRRETRFSVTQYTAGAIFRWVDQGYQTKEEFLAKMSPAERAAFLVQEKRRFEEGLNMFTTLDDLRSADADSDLSEIDE